MKGPADSVWPHLPGLYPKNFSADAARENKTVQFIDCTVYN